MYCCLQSRAALACQQFLCAQHLPAERSCISPDSRYHHCCLQAARPSAIIDLIRSAEQFRFQQQTSQKLPQPRTCQECGFISSQPVCKACTLLQGLNKGRPRRVVRAEEGGGAEEGLASSSTTQQCDEVSTGEQQACGQEGRSRAPVHSIEEPAGGGLKGSVAGDAGVRTASSGIRELAIAYEDAAVS